MTGELIRYPDAHPYPHRISIGDIVRMRNGGVKMLVVDIEANKVTAGWCGPQNKPIECEFQPHMLRVLASARR